MTARRAIVSALLGLALGGAVISDAGAQSCADSGGVGYVCGTNNPEDLIRVDGTPFVLVGNMGDTDSQGGGFNEVHATTRRVRAITPTFSSPKDAAYRDCPGPPDPAKFSVHGLDLKTDGAARTVYAVNHGGRESIEVFRLEASDSGLALTWIGCALLPESHAANSVAALGDGGFVTTVPVLSEDELLTAGLERPTGAIYRWSPSSGWSAIPDVEISFPNGILVAPGGATLFVAGYTEQTVAKLSLASGASASKVAVPFNPDNLRWSPDGTILATGQKAEPAQVQITCVSNPTVETCEVPTGVSEIAPGRLRATTVFEREGDENFGAGTSAIVVGSELWIGSFRAQRLLRVPFRALSAPVASEEGARAPQLRLVRRCLRGRLRVELRGDVDRVRDVNFKFGKRLIARETSAPFRRTLSRRARRSTKARRLRAVAYVRGGRPFRVILARSLPRC